MKSVHLPLVAVLAILGAVLALSGHPAFAAARSHVRTIPAARTLGRRTLREYRPPEPESIGPGAVTINIADLNALNPAVAWPTARPPTFGGQPAFFADAGDGVGGCPLPP